MNHVEYNGWYNYETWVCALWLQNDEGSCQYWEEITNDCDSIEELSQKIKDDIDEGNTLDDVSSMYADLMLAAISEINFYEIAKSFWNDYREKVEDKAKEVADDMADVFEANKDDKDCVKEGYDDTYISVYYGSVLDIAPSGKYYMPFACSNVTEEEANEDEDFFEELERLLSEKGLWYESGEGDALDIFVCGEFDFKEEED